MTMPARYDPPETQLIERHTPIMGIRHERHGPNHDPVVHVYLPASRFYLACFAVLACCLLTILTVKDAETTVRNERAGVAEAILTEAESRGLVSTRECSDATVRVLTFGDC